MEDKNNKNDTTAKLVVNKAADYLNKITERSHDNENNALGNKTLETLIHVDENTERTNSLLFSMKSALISVKQQQSSSPAKSLIRTDESGEGEYKNRSLKLLESIDSGIKNMGETGIGGMLLGALGLVGSMFGKARRLFGFAAKMIKGIFKFGKNPLKFLKEAFVDFFSFIKTKFLKVIESLLSFIPKPIRELESKIASKSKGLIKNVAEKTGGIIGKAKAIPGRLIKGAGRLIGKTAVGGMVGRSIKSVGTGISKVTGKIAGSAVGKIASKGLAKVAGKGLMKGGMKALGNAAKFIPGLGEAVAIGMMAFDAVDGWNNAAKILGKKEADIKTMDKVKAAGASILSGLTFGIIDASTFAKWMGNITKWALKAGAFVWDKIKMLGGAIWDGIKWAGQKLEDAGSFIWDSIKTFAGNVWDGVKWVGEKIADVVSYIWDMYKNFYGAIWDGINWVADKFIKGFKVAFNFFKGIAKKIVTTAIDSVKSIGETITSIWDRVVAFVVDGAKGVLNKVKKFLHLGGEDEKKPEDKKAEEAAKVIADKDKVTQENNKKGIVTDAKNKFDFGGEFKSMKGTAEQKLAQVFMNFLLEQYAPYSAELNAAAMNKDDVDAMSKVPIRIVEPMR